jgi:hypothetical protein
MSFLEMSGVFLEILTPTLFILFMVLSCGSQLSWW